MSDKLTIPEIEAYIRSAAADGLIHEIDLDDANLAGVNLPGVNLAECIMPGANLRGAKLMGASLQSADLSLANARGANFRGADMRRVNLTDAMLWETCFDGADLEAAIVTRADFYGAKLQRANLTDVDLSTAIMDFAIMTLPWGMSDRNDDVAYHIDDDFEITLITDFFHGDVDDFIERINRDKSGNVRIQYLARALSLVAHHDYDGDDEITQLLAALCGGD